MVDLPSFNGTNVWFAPGTVVNSTEAFDHASHLEEVAYLANRYLFIAIMVILGLFIVVQIPHTVIRLAWSPSLWYNFRLGKSMSPPEAQSTTRSNEKAGQPPRRISHIRRPIPPRHIPYIDLPLTEFLLVLILWATGLGIAGWCQASFLTHASRSTLIVMALLSLTAALGVKSGGVGTWVTYGYTSVNFLHRWTGRLVLLLTTLHVIAYLIVFQRAGIARQEMRKPENYLAAMAYGGLCLTGLGSIRPVRRHLWLTFKFAHHIGIVLLLAGLNYHSPGVLPYLIAIWILLTFNAIVRSITTRITTAHITALPGSSSTLVTFPKLTRGFTPGQHVRLRMFVPLPTGGWWSYLESHPFTIASQDGPEGGIQLIAKSAGDWTKALNSVAGSVQGGRNVHCLIEGPYGGPINFLFPSFASVLIVVGGSGISFGLGVTAGLLAEAKKGRAACMNLTLVWTVRTKAELDGLGRQLQDLVASALKVTDSQPDFRLTLILSHTVLLDLGIPPVEVAEEKVEKTKITSLLKEMETDTISVQLRSGRPDLKQILEDVVRTTAKGGVGVGVCGPHALSYHVEELVFNVTQEDRKRVGGVEVHAERFSL
ncbi:hypothetical protein CI109_103901 [Kwoniella shandongensis]|uniref:ferric-chelate reductase (NADPH) n=1 Tax=Kwoniella shandongensis TaxID=1734106 RepID=A0A5M6BYL3_9TREE|nr:uncharacterized protein CI109_005645 [Kwoniella shandongensis]KAA5526049.1 hypothetical protein CI109_005645 [Kwoniella shandongensis]